MTKRMGYCPYGTHGDARSTWLHYETPECRGFVSYEPTVPWWAGPAARAQGKLNERTKENERGC